MDKIAIIKYLSLLFGVLLTHTPSESQAQSLWDLGTIPLYGFCAKNGLSDDLWVLPTHCKSYKGTVGCDNGVCRCNLQMDAYFDKDLQACVGRVGAPCTFQHSSVIPDKLCTPNAECRPLRGEGAGDSTGRCECVHGYKNDTSPGSAGMCVEDDEVEDEDRATPRPIEVPEPPKGEDFKLPPLGLLFNTNTVELNEACHPTAMLNKTYCATYNRTVSCVDRKCQCSLPEDQVFDADLNVCVGRVGSWCLTRRYIFGQKLCVKNAVCQVEFGDAMDFSFGTCQCEYGYVENEESGGCDLDDTVPVTTTSEETPTTTEEEDTTSSAVVVTLSNRASFVSAFLLTLVSYHLYC